MKHTKDAIVGFVVIGVAIATIGAVAWVKQVDIGSRRHDVYAQFRDVGNARVGNSVVIRGVVGGRIEGIELAPAGWVKVRMKLDPTVQLPADPVVLLNESSLFGDWQATIVERGALPRDAAVQREVNEASGGRELPGVSLPGIGKLTAVAGQIAGDIANAASRIGTAFDDQAARELRASIRNVADLSATLRSVARDHASDLDTLSNQLRIAVRTMNTTAGTVELTARRLDSAVTSDEIAHLVENFSIASAELRQAAAQVRDLSARLVATQAKADAFLATGDSVLSKINHGQGSLGLFVNDATLYHRADSALTELKALTADIRANPKKYLSIRLF